MKSLGLTWTLPVEACENSFWAFRRQGGLWALKTQVWEMQSFFSRSPNIDVGHKSKQKMTSDMG